ncbi:uncharacterized protein LOC8288906 [Ricinus communis]|uniref:Uncharacterized protein n=1 Tax=Ricinus communis TaxID=3988 RepID=B9R7S1_RICCO|nr:uncharacterized protein LOC8288906 [Ricinus communis]EEF52551.1 hypothetical protein RCOM_1593930 [Ricinus communis]|eukprot:XP_002510364.1 uncharacterized protein LOC8288906 [Ricinus communis]
MELRSCTHVHFVQAVKGGLVTKVLNVYRGKPALKFKVVKDIYGTEDTNTFAPVPAYRPEFEFADFPIECDRPMDESLCTFEDERITVKSEDETPESSSEGSENGAKELDDLIFGNMTLKQIKERCKKKKRKSFRFVDSSDEDTCTPGKPNHFSLQSEEDEYDIMEPLSCWKSKILKKKKTQKKCRGDSVRSSSQNALSIVKFEETPSDQVIFQHSENFPAPIAIKVEFPEPSYSGCKDMIFVAVDPSFSCNEPLFCSGMICYEEPETADDYDSLTGTSVLAIEEPDTPNDRVSGTEMSAIFSEELTTNACGFETQTFFSDEPQCCAVNEQSYEYMEHAYPKSIIGVQASDGEITEGSEGEMVMEAITDLISHQFSELSIIPDVNKEDSVMDQNPKSDSPDFKSFPCVHEKSQKTSRSSQVQVSEVKENNNLQHTQFNKGIGSHLLDDEAANDALHAEASVTSRHATDCSSPWNSNLCSSPKVDSFSVTDYYPIAEENRSSLSVGADVARNCSSKVHSCINEPAVSAKVEECHQSKLQHPPERLLSTRTVISPTSQKKLREALECTELDAEQYYKYARKLCYGKQTENKNGRSEGANQIKKAEVSISPKKVVKKPKIDSNGFHQNGKVPCPSRAVQRFSSGCTSIQTCSESAILFSQQQMRDIESVTTKLAKELQSMRDIVEEKLQSEVYPATSLKYNAEEMRIAVQNATRVEESARKSVSVMARDCNRFCKIMKLAEKGSAASPNVVRKKRKIVFADEAGGKLCDIKTFDNDMSSFTEPKGQTTVTVD